MTALILPPDFSQESPAPRPFNELFRAREIALLMEGIRTLAAEGHMHAPSMKGDDEEGRKVQAFTLYAREMWEWYLAQNLVDMDSRHGITQTIKRVTKFLVGLTELRSTEVFWIDKIQKLPCVKGYPFISSGTVSELVRRHMASEAIQSALAAAGQSSAPPYEFFIAAECVSVELQLVSESGQPLKAQLHSCMREEFSTWSGMALDALCQAESISEAIPEYLRSKLPAEAELVKQACATVLNALPSETWAAMRRHPQLVYDLLGV